MRGSWTKGGLIWKPENVHSWWQSHAMAPAPVKRRNGTIRVYLGAWQSGPCSRIGFVDLDPDDPSRIVEVSEVPVVDVGVPGTFDDSGVFPGHVTRTPNGEIYLYYTGFQNSTKSEVDHFNFSGLAISRDDGDSFEKFSQAPILDRADEGLHVRAGLSSVADGDGYECAYSAGTGFSIVGGKLRPHYDVYCQRSPDGISFSTSGRLAVQCVDQEEHGLGRPQLLRWEDVWLVIYTRRRLNMRYDMGCAWSKDLTSWSREDDWLSIPHGDPGSFDSEMVYFPAILQDGESRFLFYSGNGYGREGLGFARWSSDGN